jgi:hypothetical protein
MRVETKTRWGGFVTVFVAGRAVGQSDDYDDIFASSEEEARQILRERWEATHPRDRVHYDSGLSRDDMLATPEPHFEVQEYDNPWAEAGN